MTPHRVTATRRIAAPPQMVYSVIADYRDGHQRIVPPRVFRNMCVESGGVGDGTVISFDMVVFRSTRRFRATIAEPSPGHVLTERDETSGTLTSFLVQGVDSGRSSDVTIMTEMQVHGGLAGMIERMITTRFLRSVYEEELALLDGVARRGPPPPAD